MIVSAALHSPSRPYPYLTASYIPRATSQQRVHCASRRIASDLHMGVPNLRLPRHSAYSPCRSQHVFYVLKKRAFNWED
jgi:hypothetical protein